MLNEDFDAFSTKYTDDTVYPKAMESVSFRNKFGVTQSEEGWFNFEYKIWWRMHSNEPRCYAGVHMTTPIPTCNL